MGHRRHDRGGAVRCRIGGRRHIALPTGLGLALFAVASSFAAARAWKRSEYSAQTPARSALFAAPVFALALIGSILTYHGISGRLNPSGQSLDLDAPLQGEGYCAINAGASPLINFHYKTLESGYERWRGQSYGVDFVRVTGAGFRTATSAWWKPAPRAPEAYQIFGAEIHAPCSGVVTAAHDGLRDHPAGVRERHFMRGNFVAMQCGGYEVTLAHMREGSVRAGIGDQVRSGDVLGQVGNTGNTDEPHLHVSAQRAISPGMLDGDPIHITFARRTLARGDCL
jgi:murein DD-endopeptidase MepM/ murein hydrolase activator NlpD